MPVTNLQRVACDVCGATLERELIPHQPKDGWLFLSVSDGLDKRKRRKAAICPDCSAAITIEARAKVLTVKQDPIAPAGPAWEVP